MRRRPVIILLVIMMFGFSTESHAFMEWLYKLSGPGPFIGFKMGARFTCLQGEDTGCELIEWGIGSGLFDDRPCWNFNLGGGVSWSIRNDLNYRTVSPPEVKILSLEPAVEFWPTEKRKFFMGLGYAFNKFRGQHFTDFSRDAIVLRVGKRWDTGSSHIPGVELGVKYVHFEERFRPSDFGAIGNDPEERGVFGLFGTVYFAKRQESETPGKD